MTRIASWNSARDVWETEAVSLLSGRSDVFSETFPISGMTVNGVAYELPMSGHRMDDSGSLFSQLGGKLPDGSLVFDTPDTMPDAPNSGSNRKAQPAGLGNQVKTLLPTPRASDGAHGGPNQRGSKGDLTVSSAVALLPTPRSNEANGIGVHGTGGADLRTTVALMPTPRATRGGSATEMAYGLGGERSDEHRAQGTVELSEDGSWGPYAAAIERWQTVLGRPAPQPTEPGAKGGRRLSAVFVEWMMGVPDGWVTAPKLGLSRVQQLRMLGNGVVTNQAIAALRSMRAARSINEGEK